MAASKRPSHDRSPSPQSSVAERATPHEKKKSAMTLEAEHDLIQFLKVVRPSWSTRQKRGHSDIHRVIEKLKDINVNDISQLMQRVNANTINDDLLEAGHNRFSRETLTSIRNQASFVRALDHLKEPYFRQTGTFDPVPQLFAGTNLRHKKFFKTNGGPELRLGESSNKSSTSPKGSRPASIATSRSNIFDNSNGTRTKRPNTVGDVMLGEVTFDDDLSGGNSINTGFSTSDDQLSPEGFSGLFASSSASESSLGRTGYTLRRTNHRRKNPNYKKVSLLPEKCQSATGSMSMPEFLATAYESMEESRPVSNGSGRTGSAGHDSRCQSRNGRGRWERCGSAASSLWGLGETGMDDCDSEGAHSQASPFFDEWTKAEEQIKSEPWVAKWGSGRSLLHCGGHMLKEQRALESKKNILQEMDLEGNKSPLRQHVASQIKNRLKEEKERDAQNNLDFWQTCTNIGKQLRHMQATRRDLTEQRKKLHDLIHGPEAKPTPLVGLSPELFLQSKKLHSTVVSEMCSKAGSRRESAA